MNNSQNHDSLNKLLKEIKPGQIAIALFESFPDVLFWVKDSKGNFLYVNRAFSEYT